MPRQTDFKQSLCADIDGFCLLAPPVGLNACVVNCMLRDRPFAGSYRGVQPFLAADVLRTLRLRAFPALTLRLVYCAG